MLPVLVGLAGCTLNAGVPDRVEPVAVTGVRVSSDIEEAIGRRENPRVIAEYGGVYSDPAIEAALAKTVARLVAASNDPSRRYRITILDSPVANAFALPGGFLYVTRGLLALADDTSELAAVLSHEIAHVLANHALERARAVEHTDIVEQVAASVLSDPAAGRSAVLNSQRTLAKFSRDQEIEADRIGIAIAAQAGYDPFAASRFIDKLERYGAIRSAVKEGGQAADFLASHPAALERRELAVRAARQFGAPGIGEQGRNEYLQSLDGLVFGDDPTEGFVRGRSFLHPGQAIGFTVPDGFRLENTRDAVLAAAGPNTAMRFDGAAAETRMPPESYLTSGWVNGLTEGSVATATVNGLPVATAEANAGEWMFRIAAVKVDNRMFRMIFASRDGQVDIAAALSETLSSFRRLKPREVARLQPLKIRIVKVRPGETVDGVARRMKGGGDTVTMFRLLNGLDDPGALEPGQLIKLVVD